MTNGVNFSHVAGGLLRACDHLEVKVESQGGSPTDLLVNPQMELGFLRLQALESMKKAFQAFVKLTDGDYGDEEVEIYARLLSLENLKKNVSLKKARTILAEDVDRLKKPVVHVEHYFPHFLRVAMTNESAPVVENLMEQFFLTVKLMTNAPAFTGIKGVGEIAQAMTMLLLKEYYDRAEVRPELLENSQYLDIITKPEEAESDAEGPGFILNVKKHVNDMLIEQIHAYEKLDDPWVDTSPTALEQINRLVGHAQIKKFAEEIMRREKGSVKSLKKRFCKKADSDDGGSLSASGHHMVLMGNPGTGKTTVANLLGQLFKEAGILKRGHLVSVSAKDLIAGYVGQTAIKTGKLLDRAEGGVLFIDEAYKMFDGNGAEFASESVTELLVAMENRRDKMVVVFAGYSEPMHKLLESNEGLPRRIKHYVTCEDYSVPELMQIRDTLSDVEGHVMDDEAAALFKKITADNKEAVEAKFWGNGGFVRDFLQNIVQKQEDRLETSGVLNNYDPNNPQHQNKIHTILTTLTADDIRAAELPVPAFLKEGRPGVDNVSRNGAGFIPYNKLKKEAEAEKRKKMAEAEKQKPAALPKLRVV